MLSDAPTYLIFACEPTAPENGFRSFSLSPSGIFAECTLAETLQASGTIVTYDTTTLADADPSIWRIQPPELIDIDLALALHNGAPRIASGRDRPFSFFEYLKKQNDDRIEVYLSYCFQNDRSNSKSQLRDSARYVAEHLKKLWRNLYSNLQSDNELGRLLEVEIPVSKAMLQRQANGIRINEAVLKETLVAQHRAAATARQVLRRDFSVLDPRDRVQVRRAISKDSYLSNVIRDEDSDQSLQSILKLYAEKSPFAEALREHSAAERSRTILLRCGGLTSGRVHPDFRVMGTVTGRVIARNPPLQNLAKRYRNVLKEDAGMALLYPDFKQCEPGILAHDSKDESLIRDYNAGDLYLALSNALFNDSEHRAQCKLLFLFVCYGMAEVRVSQIASDLTGVPQVEVARVIKRFFDRYPGIGEWRANLIQLVKTSGRIETLLGNRRRFSAGDSQAATLRGAQSQRIQGTAALILKRTIINLQRDLPEVEILLPMHDALLVQVPFPEVLAMKPKIEHVFKNTFQAVCPSIQPRVSFEDFAPTEINV